MSIDWSKPLEGPMIKHQLSTGDPVKVVRFATYDTDGEQTQWLAVLPDGTSRIISLGRAQKARRAGDGYNWKNMTG